MFDVGTFSGCYLDSYEEFWLEWFICYVILYECSMVEPSPQVIETVRQESG